MWDRPAEEGEPTVAEAPAAPRSNGDSYGSTPLADEGEGEGAFEPPALHPDIAKALAESTYADSATAITAMAARLGAADDDEDDWDDGSEPGGQTNTFWSSDGDTSGGAAAKFTWQPAAGTRASRQRRCPTASTYQHDPDDPSGPAGSADPEWLENLYSQFMPGEGQAGGKGPNSVESALGAAPANPAPKTKTLRRLMSAIKRL